MKSRNSGKITVGHPVDVASGTLFHEFEDFTQPGRVPLVFGRRYSTALISQRDGMFGQGWSSPFEMKLRRDLDGWRLIGEDGETEIPFDDEAGIVESGSTVRNLGIFHELRQEEREVIVTRWNPDSEEVVRYVFHKGTDDDWWPLASRRNLEGHGVDIRRDQYGRILALRQRREGRGYRLTYNSAARVSEVYLFAEDHERLILRYAYDNNGRLSNMTDALGNRCSYEYDEAGRMTREVNIGGMEFRFRYDSTGRCIETTGPDGFDRQLLEFNHEARLTRVTDPLGFITTYEWNETGQVEKKISPLGHTAVTVYDSYGRIVQTISPGGAVTSCEFDDHGDRVTTTEPTGAVTKYEFNEDHQVIGLTDGAGHKWIWSFDENGRVSEWRDPLDSLWRYSYNSQGDLVSLRDPLGAERHFVWDGRGNLTSGTDFLEHRTNYEYDDEGRITTMIDPLGHRTEVENDPLGRIRLIRRPDGTSRKFSWNVYDQITEHIDELGATTRWRYTPCGLLRKIIRPHGGQIRFKYTNVPGQLISLTNENGLQHHYQYDADARMIQQTDFGGRVTRYQYNKDGRVTVVEKAAGHRTELQLDAAGAVVKLECDDGSKITYEYDHRGYLIKADNGACPVEREYDPAGRLIREKQGQYIVENAYDGAGNRLRRQSSLHRLTAFQWDANGQITKIQADALDPIMFEYDALQHEVGRYVQGGARINQEFDERGRQVEQWTGRRRLPGKITVGSRTGEAVHRQYRYDASSRITEMLDARWGSTKYKIDGAGRITVAEHPNITERFSYDPADNFKKLELSVASSTESDWKVADQTQHWRFGKDNELLERDGVAYEYDAFGQLARKTDKEGETIYEWDRLGQLAVVTLPDGSKWTYKYDPFGRRIEKRGPSRQAEFVWDGDVILHEVRSREKLQTDLVSWDFDPYGFSPIAKSESEEQYLCVNSVAGTPCELITKTGTVVWAARISAFGETRSESLTTVDCPVRFQGQWFDDETRLHYNRFRYYDPAIGRYVSRDPLGLLGGVNPYSYVSNPTLWIDPFGLATIDGNGFFAPRNEYGRGSGGGRVRIPYQGTRDRDFTLANRLAGFSSTPVGYTWHHANYNSRTGYGDMQLVRTTAHDTPHSGGVSQFQQSTGIKYDTPEAVQHVENEGRLRGKPCGG